MARYPETSKETVGYAVLAKAKIGTISPSRHMADLEDWLHTMQRGYPGTEWAIVQRTVSEWLPVPDNQENDG